MSKEIDLTKPLDAFDIKYLVDRCRWDDLRQYAENMNLEVPDLPDAVRVRAQEPTVGVNAYELPGAYDALVAAGVKRADEASKLTDEQGETDPPVPVPQPSVSPENGPEKNKPLDYKALTVPQLKEILDERRRQATSEGADEDILANLSYTNETRKDDLIAKLELDDESLEDSDDDED